jgi:tetratricopeptide (TPR) repeat protein
MDSNREKTANFLFAAAITGLTVLSASERVASFGINLASGLTEKGLAYVCQRFFREAPRLSHDLKEALRRALLEAIDDLESDYQTDRRYDTFTNGNPEVAWQVHEYFKLLRKEAEGFFSAIFTTDAGIHLADNEQVQQLFYGDRRIIDHAVEQYLNKLFYGEMTGERVTKEPLYEGGKDLLDFLGPLLVERWTDWFNEELKGHSRAQWDFERLFLEIFRRDVLDHLEKMYGLIEASTPMYVELRNQFEGLLKRYDLFGGREAEKADIKAFLGDPQGGYLFVTGRSGYGKTALLARCITGHEGIIYHFINRVDGHADEEFFLQNLCEQLLARHKLHGHLPRSMTELRALYSYLLQLAPNDGEPVVIMIDGVDEADWNWHERPEYFSSDLPYKVKVVFSAREVADRDWPSYLNLLPERVRRLVLGAMTPQDIHSLLHEAGGSLAILADDSAWIQQVEERSNGDPFYVGLLMKDLQSGDITPAQISEQPKGLDEYLTGWWRQINDAKLKVLMGPQDVRDVLGTLAVAHGRLQRDDLVEMFVNLAMALDAVLDAIRRFVIGDEHNGYALCHPRFIDFVQQKIKRNLIEKYTDSLLAHCANWRTHHSKYARAHYVRHLADAGRENDIWNLIVETPDWLAEQTLSDPSRMQYTQQIEEAIRLSAKRGIDRLPQIVAYSLLYASIGSQVTDVPLEMFGLMASLDKEEQALRFAKLVTNPFRQAEGYVTISEELLMKGKVDQCLEVLILAREVADKITDNGKHASALSKIAKVWNQAGKKETAWEILAAALELTSHERYGMGSALIDLAATAISTDAPRAVLSQLVSQALENWESGATSTGIFICHLATILGRGGYGEEVARLLKIQPGLSEYSVIALAWIAFGLTLAGDIRATRYLAVARKELEQDSSFRAHNAKEAVEVAYLAVMAHSGTMTDPINILHKAFELYDFRSQEALDVVVQAMIKNGNLEYIQVLAERLPELRVELLIAYAQESARLGKLDESHSALKRALQAIDYFTTPPYADWPNRTKRLCVVVEAMQQRRYSEGLQEALDAAAQTEGKTLRAKACAAVAQSLAHIGNQQRAQEVLDDLLQTRESTGGSQSEVRAWSHLMLAIASSGDKDTACEVAQKALHAAEKWNTCEYITADLIALAQGFAHAGDKEGLAEMLSTVQRIKEGDYSRGKILIGIAVAMLRIDDRSGLANAIDAAAKIDYVDASFQTLVEMAHDIAKIGDVEGLLQVVAAARSIVERPTHWGFTDVASTVELALVQMGKRDEADEIFSFVPWKDILSWIGTSERDHSYRLTVYNLARSFALRGQLDEALELAEYTKGYFPHRLDRYFDLENELRSGDSSHPSKEETCFAVMFTWLLQAEPSLDHASETRAVTKILERIGEDDSRFYGLLAVARPLAKSRAFPQARVVLDIALQIAETIQDREKQREAFIMTAEILVEIDEIPLAREVLASVKDLIEDINDARARIVVMTSLSDTMVRVGESSQAQNVMENAIGQLKRLEADQDNTEFYADCLTRIASLYAQLGRNHRTAELLQFAVEATKQIENVYIEVSLLTKQARMSFGINNPEQAQQIASYALESFRRSRDSSAINGLVRQEIEDIASVLAENAEKLPHEMLFSLLLNAFYAARSRGRDEVLEYIASFAPVLCKLGMAKATWERIQSVEALLA